MKIVQINAIYEKSSTGRTTKEMHEWLIAHNIDSYVFCSTGIDEKRKIGSPLDHKWHAFMSRVSGKQGYFSKRATRQLIHRLEQIMPDILILRNFHANYVNLPMLLHYCINNNIATIVVLHDCWFFTGHCCHYTEIDCQKWQHLCSKCPMLKIDHESWLFDKSETIFKDKKSLFTSIPRLGIVGVSDWITNEARKSPIFQKAAIIERIYNWIDLKTFYPRDASDLRKMLGLKDSDFVALGVSMTWDYKKGLDKFIEVAAVMPEIRVVMIGERPAISFPTNVVFVRPTTSTDELAKFYSMADVLFNFSIQETFGKVAAESLACGTPVIVNDATANPEIVGECGVVIRDNNLSQIVNAVKNIREKSKCYYAERCVNRANQLFDKNKNLELYVNLFKYMSKW